MTQCSIIFPSSDDRSIHHKCTPLFHIKLTQKLTSCLFDITQCLSNGEGQNCKSISRKCDVLIQNKRTIR